MKHDSNTLIAYCEEVTRYDDLIERDIAAVPELVARDQAESEGIASDNLLGYIELPDGEIILVTQNTFVFWKDHASVVWLCD